VANIQLNTPINFLKGIGEQRAALLLKELELETVFDLLQFFPLRYSDRTTFITVQQAIQDAYKSVDLKEMQLKGLLRNMHVIGGGRKRRLTAEFYDGTGSMELVWFNGIPWLQKWLKADTQYIIYGKPSIFQGNVNFMHPEIEPAAMSEYVFGGKMQPVYSGTEKLRAKGITSKLLGKWMQVAFEQLPKTELYENLPEPVQQKYKLIGRWDAYYQIHFPVSDQHLQHAIRRLKFEELFIDQVKMLRIKQFRHTNSMGFIFKELDPVFNDFYNNHLPFSLTDAQKRVLKEIRKDVLSGRQMNRLLQGDVGSGKTVVALLTMLMAVDNDFQACLMAPTEILAQQHFAGIAELLAKLPLGVALLTGSIKGKQRKQILEAVEAGEIQLLIGTHALIEDTVKFRALGCVIIDEQHRFGVEQRSKLWSKNTIAPHILVMTATPIPRTLSMAFFGDLDVSIIDQLPPGRKPIKTIHKRESERLEVFGFIKKQIAEGRQIFIVYPLIEESEKLDLKNLMQGAEMIERDFPRPQYQASILHGRMTAAEKDAEMQRFIKKQTHIMISTTVIEVGVNIPNATVMVVENAERFGLAQLHQLRGRVGRGAHQSYCVLMTENKLNADARKRIQTMVQTNDGFVIAEVDMQLRGPGEIEGTRQSGAAQYLLANVVTDEAILKEARLTAEQILDEDPGLQSPVHAALKKFLSTQTWKIRQWGKIG